MARKITLLSFAKKQKQAKKEADRQIIKFLRKQKPGNVLIIPAEAGLEADYAQKKGFSVTAVDDDFDLIKQARARNRDVVFHYSSFSSFAKKTPRDQFDYIVDNCFSQTLLRESIPGFYTNIARLLKYNGRLYTKVLSISDAYCKSHCPKRQWTYVDEKYVNFFRRKFLITSLKKAGFHVDSYKHIRTEHTFHTITSTLKLMKL